MELHGVCKCISFSFEDKTIILFGENHDPIATGYNRYHKHNVINHLIDLVKEFNGCKMYVEDTMYSREKWKNKDYSKSPIPKISDTFRYGEFDKFEYSPIDLRTLGKQSICWYVKTSEVNEFSITMNKRQVELFNLKFNRKIKPYINHIFEYVTCRNTCETNLEHYEFYFMLILKTAGISDDVIHEKLLLNRKYRSMIEFHIKVRQEKHDDLERFYDVLFSSVFVNITPHSFFDIISTIEMDVYFLLGFVPDENTIIFTGSRHTLSISNFIQSYYGLTPEIDASCKYNENLII